VAFMRGKLSYRRPQRRRSRDRETRRRSGLLARPCHLEDLADGRVLAVAEARNGPQPGDGYPAVDDYRLGDVDSEHPAGDHAPELVRRFARKVIDAAHDEASGMTRPSGGGCATK